MVILLFTASFLLSLAVSYVIAKLFRESAEGFLSRFFARPLSAAAAKYLEFVIVFVGVTSGTRIHLLQDYIDAPPLESAGACRPAHPGGLGPFHLPHPGRSPLRNCVAAGRVRLPGAGGFLLPPPLALDFAPRKGRADGRPRRHQARHNRPLEFKAPSRSNARRRTPGRGCVRLLPPRA